MGPWAHGPWCPGPMGPWGPGPQEIVLKNNAKGVEKKPSSTKDKGWRSRKEGVPGLETWKRGMGLRYGLEAWAWHGLEAWA